MSVRCRRRAFPWNGIESHHETLHQVLERSFRWRRVFPAVTGLTRLQLFRYRFHGGPSWRRQRVFARESERGDGFVQFILRRLTFYVVAAWFAITVNFAIPRVMPGNAVDTMLAKFPTLDANSLRALQAEFGTHT